MASLEAIAQPNGLVIIEDAAQALGSRFRGQSAGTFGAAAAISFFPAKILGCLGDGGAVVTNNDQVHQRALQLHDHGRGAGGEIESWGLNSRLDNLQAAILDARLEKLGAVLDRRRALARLYRARLENLDLLRLPPGPDGDAEHFDVYQNYEIEAVRRDGLKAHLQSCGIGAALPWGGKAVHQWEKLGFREKLPFTEKLFEEMLLLPLNMSLEDDDVNIVCDAIQAFYRG
jgi:dTDP-4-amino-4,6-dideoxygalactose transaminase